MTLQFKLAADFMFFTFLKNHDYRHAVQSFFERCYQVASDKKKLCSNLQEAIPFIVF